MRITHFCFCLDFSRGGVVTGLMNTVEQLTKNGISNQIISFGNTRKQINANSLYMSEINSLGVDYIYTVARFKNDYGLGSLRGLKRKLCNLTKSNLVVIHQIYTFSTLLGYIYAKTNDIPYVIQPHGSLTKYHEADSKLIKFLAKGLIISRILREADAIVVTCESEREDLKPMLQAKACQLNYGAIPNSSVNQTFRKLPENNENLRIIFSGRFDKKKNLSLVIRAMPLILKMYPELILDIAGSGTKNELKMLRNLVSSLSLEGSVQFHGWINRLKLSELLANARLLVLPSENENFAIVVAEALSAGVPCVVSKFVGTADIVAKYHAGEVIDELSHTAVAKGILKVLQGDEIKYREAAIEAVTESLDWSEIALKWKALVRSLA